MYPVVKPVVGTAPLGGTSGIQSKPEGTEKAVSVDILSTKDRLILGTIRSLEWFFPQTLCPYADCYFRNGLISPTRLRFFLGPSNPARSVSAPAAWPSLSNINFPH